MSAVDGDRLGLYAATVLEIGGDQPITVDLRRPLSAALRSRMEDELADRFTIITAENPLGSTASDNHTRTRRLSGALRDEQLSFVPALGRNPSGTHRENGFAVMGEMEPVMELARAFQQDAVFRFEHGRFMLVEVATGRSLPLPLRLEPS